MNLLRLSLLLFGTTALGTGTMWAQNEKELNETTAAHGFVENQEGMPYDGISIPEDRVDAVAGMSQKLTNWEKSDAVAVHYFRHPAAEVETRMLLKVTSGKTVTFKLRIYDPANLSTPLKTVENISVKGDGTEQEVSLVKYVFPHRGYYRYCLECTSGCTDIIEISKFRHYSPSTEKTYKSGYLSSPSVHLSDWKSTQSGAPTGENYDWCYHEVMMPKESDITGTYVMSMGLMNGYMGIQMNGYENGKSRHDIIFSIWDKGSTDRDPNLPDNLRAKLVDKNEKAVNERFGNEGTGMKSFMAGHFWECGTFVQFITNCRKEVATFVDQDGQTKTQENTLVSAWFNAQDGRGWQYISTLRMPAQHKRFDSWYSFLENYNWSSGQKQRKGYYRNGYGCDGSGKWYHFNRINASHTDGERDKEGNEIVGKRYDYGFGPSEECVGPNGEKAFFMTTGGFTAAVENPADPGNYECVVPLNAKNTAVDTIQLDVLLKRVDQAIVNEKIAKIQNAYLAENKLSKTGWSIKASDEETTGEPNGNGFASKIIDGDDNTYWHSSWQSSGATGCPHSMVIDMQKIKDIAGMDVLMSTRTDRMIQSVKVSASQDNNSWNEIYANDNVPSSRNLHMMFSQISPARYLKLDILKASNDNGHVSVHEINVLGYNAQATEDLKTQIKLMLENPNAKDVGYPSVAYFNDLQRSYNDLCANGSVDTYLKAQAALVMYNNGSDFILPETGVLYTIATQNRGNWVALSNRFESTANNDVKIPVDYTNEKQQFMFVEENGKYYLYSPSLKKYLTKKSNVLSDQPQDAFTIIRHNELGKIFMSFDVFNNINFGGDNQLVINDYKTFDEGNAFDVEAVGVMADLKTTAGALAEKNVATFSAPFAVNSESGVKVYYVTEGASDDVVDLVAVEAGKAIPANAGVLVAANDQVQTRLIKASDDTPVTELTGNLLRNSAVAPVKMEAGDYILLKPESKSMAFYKAKVGSELPRYRAYLHMGSAAATIHMNLGGAATGIEGVENSEKSNALIYDLSGRQVNQVVKGGVYIQNGKKFIVK